MDSHASKNTEQPIADQIAALFLKDKDVDCMNCGYNRRNGTQSACPECGTNLTLTSSHLLDESQYRTLSRIALIAVMSIAGIQLAGLVYWYVRYFLILEIFTLSKPVIFVGVSALFWSIFVFIPMIQLLKAKKNQHTITLRFTTTILYGLAGCFILIRVSGELFNALFF